MSLEEKKTILLVEDDLFTAMATKMQVQKFGYNVVVANSGEDAVKMAKDDSDISLILMDIDLGGIDGTETAREILAVRHIPIVFLTSHTEEDYVKRVKEITRYGYVVKNSGAFVLKSSIEMAFELFNQFQKTKESEQRHRLLFETMSPGVVYQSAEGHIISANPSAEKILGLTLEQMMGKTSSDPRWRMITEEGMEVPGNQHPSMVALKTGQKVGPVIRGVFIPEKNEYIWLSITAIPLFKSGEDKPYEVYATFEDITERKNAEDKIKTLQKLLQETGKMAKVGGWELDGKTLEVSWTEQTYHIHEVPLDYKPPLQEAINFYHPKDREILSKSIDNALKYGKPYDLELRFITAKGNHLWVHAICNPQIKDGEVVKLTGTFQDITERKNAEMMLKKSESAMRQLNETKDKFFSIIAHDLRNPVNAFISSTQILKDHLETSVDEYAKMLSNEIYKTSQRLHELLENLLEWSQMQRGLIPYKPVKTDFFFLADYVLNLLSENAKQKHIDLQCLIKEGTFVFVDYDMIQNILTNLLSNAIKFTNGGGKITIDSKDVGDFVEISVTDTGVGMTPEKIERLFKIGEQKISTMGTAGERGTGLGLILCKEFVEKNGGTLWIESQIGMGSSLKFTMPLCKPIFE